MAEQSVEYTYLGTLMPERFEERAEDGSIVGAGSRSVPIWLCADCGGAVVDQQGHTEWHKRAKAAALGFPLGKAFGGL